MSGASRGAKVGLMLAGLALLAGIGFLLAFGLKTNQTVRVVVLEDNVFGSVCTLDFPSSSCGAYQVKVSSPEYGETMYTVAGFFGGESELHREITSSLEEARKSGVEVLLKINENNEIIAIEEQ